MMSKIPNDLMDDIINNLFHSNKNNFNLPIPKKSILRYIYELSKSGNSFLRSTQPHISLTSENSNIDPRDVVLFGFGRIGRLAARELIKQAGKGQQLRLRAIVLRKIDNI